MELSMQRAPFPSAMVAGDALSWLARMKAAAIALALHAAVIVLLLAGWGPTPKAPEQAVRTMRTQLVQLAPRKAETAIAPAVAPAPQPPAPPAKPEPVPLPKPAPVSKPVPTPARAMPQPPKETAKPPAPELAKPIEENPLASSSPPARSVSASTDNAPPQADATQVMKAAAGAQNMAASAADQSQAYLPIAKNAPEYPSKALKRGIEGDCTVSYTVTPEGRVDKPKIVGDCHPLFVRPSLQAAQEFRYRPRIVAGSAIAVPNVHNTFHYRIESR